jgi:hypothetical protein
VVYSLKCTVDDTYPCSIDKKEMVRIKPALYHNQSWPTVLALFLLFISVNNATKINDLLTVRVHILYQIILN